MNTLCVWHIAKYVGDSFIHTVKKVTWRLVSKFEDLRNTLNLKTSLQIWRPVSIKILSERFNDLTIDSIVHHDCCSNDHIKKSMTYHSQIQLLKNL